MYCFSDSSVGLSSSVCLSLGSWRGTSLIWQHSDRILSSKNQKLKNYSEWCFFFFPAVKCHEPHVSGPSGKKLVVRVSDDDDDDDDDDVC